MLSDYYSAVRDEPVRESLGRVDIQSRRYLGNKFRLLPCLEKVIKKHCRDFRSFCDLFAGTGVVGHHFNSQGVKVISNDILYSNFISLYAWLSPQAFDSEKVARILSYLNSVRTVEENYVSRHYGGRFFTWENACKIGFIREEIEGMEDSGEIDFKEKALLLTSLLYAIDKVANTCGHYDAFRKRMDSLQELELRFPAVRQDLNRGNEVYCRDANQLVSSVKCDVLYIDPPYNSRQYCDTYHLPENIIRWNKPPVSGVAAKMPREDLKSRYCLKEAPAAFADLIARAKAKLIIVSYNNMGSRGDPRSNARISDEHIIDCLSSRGCPEYYEFDYRHFSAGKNNSLEGHSERLFCVEVSN